MNDHADLLLQESSTRYLGFDSGDYPPEEGYSEDEMATFERDAQLPSVLDIESEEGFDFDPDLRVEAYERNEARFGACEDDAEVKIMWRGLI